MQMGIVCDCVCSCVWSAWVRGCVLSENMLELGGSNGIGNSKRKGIVLKSIDLNGGPAIIP